MTKLIEGKDFNYNENGEMVLSSAYLKKRGYCCQSACTNCPYGYDTKVDPNFPCELQDPWKTKVQDSDS